MNLLCSIMQHQATMQTTISKQQITEVITMLNKITPFPIKFKEETKKPAEKTFNNKCPATMFEKTRADKLTTLKMQEMNSIIKIKLVKNKFKPGAKNNFKKFFPFNVQVTAVVVNIQLSDPTKLTPKHESRE